MLIEIDNQLFETSHISCVKPSGLNKGQCVIFIVGQSAVDGGFLVNIPYKTVAKRIREAKISELLEMVEYMDAGMDQPDDDDDGYTESEDLEDGEQLQ